MQKKKKSTRRLTPFGAAVKKALVDRDMTQEMLAKEIGANGKYLHLVFYGYRSGTKYIDRIARYLNINMKSLRKAS